MKSYVFYEDTEGNLCFEVFDTELEYDYVVFLKLVRNKVIEYGLFCDKAW